MKKYEQLCDYDIKHDNYGKDHYVLQLLRIIPIPSQIRRVWYRTAKLKILSQ